MDVFEKNLIKLQARPDLVSEYEVNLLKLVSLPGVPNWSTTNREIINDCPLKINEIFANLSPLCPPEILARQEVLSVVYWSFDGKLHSGAIVVDGALISDVLKFFEFAREIKFPLQSVIPIADPRFGKLEPWSDDASMIAGNSSGFNCRVIKGTDRLSKHGLGMALDFNPHLNPFFSVANDHSDHEFADELRRASVGGFHRQYVLSAPLNGSYNMDIPGTFHPLHRLVLFMKQLGWTWGGDWLTKIDLHHFEKIPPGLEDYSTKYL